MTDTPTDRSTASRAAEREATGEGSTSRPSSVAEGIHGAMVEAQKAFKTIEKRRSATITSQKGTFTYKYADLADVLDSVVEALNEAGIYVSQPTKVIWSESNTAGLMLKTILRHADSGESLESEWPIPIQQQPQQTGSLLSYYRRYALCSLLGIAAEEEDDKTEEDTLDKTQGNKPVQRGRQKHSGQIPTNSGKTKTEVTAWVRAFVSDIHGCSDEDELDALIASNAEMIAICQKDFSNWWYGDSRNPDYEPVPQIIERRRKEMQGPPADDGSEVGGSAAAALTAIGRAKTCDDLAEWMERNRQALPDGPDGTLVWQTYNKRMALLAQAPTEAAQ